MSMLFQARSILHDAQRYATTGDWLPVGDQIEVRVSNMNNRKYEQLVAIHELIEATLCIDAGIGEGLVSTFDMLYEMKREFTTYPGATVPPAIAEEYVTARQRARAEYGCDCMPTAESEPGDDIHAPYYKQHQLATSVERMLASEMGVSWQAYENANLALYKETST